MKPLTRDESQNAIWGHRGQPDREPQRGTTGYELRNAEGAVLQASESLGSLMKYIEDKTNVTITRCRDGALVFPPERVTAQGGDST